MRVMLASRKGKEAAHMEAQARKLFGTGKAIKNLLTVFNVFLIFATVLAAAEIIGHLSKPLDEVAYVVDAVEFTVRSSLLLDIGAIIYTACMIVAYACCIKMTKKMSEAIDPFNAENVRLLRRMSVVFGVAAAAAVLFSGMNTATSGAGVENAILSAVVSATQQVVVALLLRFLADVFEYGVELQQLSDETL